LINDVVFTPKEVVTDILGYFDRCYAVRGRILDPFKGAGAFYRAFPKILRCAGNSYHWCEIAEGRDFFKEEGHYDFIISNPPYSSFTEVLRHSMDTADNIIYLIPVNKLTSSAGRVRRLLEWGDIPDIRIYEPKVCGFPFGFALGAVYMKRGYRGMTRLTVGVSPY
jgi:hypothetical protein